MLNTVSRENYKQMTKVKCINVRVKDIVSKGENSVVSPFPLCPKHAIILFND